MNIVDNLESKPVQLTTGVTGTLAPYWDTPQAERRQSIIAYSVV